MPAKFKPTEKTLDRRTKQYTTTHFYLKQTPVAELLKSINGEYTKPKQKQTDVLLSSSFFTPKTYALWLRLTLQNPAGKKFKGDFRSYSKMVILEFFKFT